MTQVYFHCSTPKGVVIDRHGAAVDDLTEACEHADLLVRALVMKPGAEDWRGWVLHVNDELDEEIFVMPFASVLGKPH
jgi:hypothetical protein